MKSVHIPRLLALFLILLLVLSFLVGTTLAFTSVHAVSSASPTLTPGAAVASPSPTPAPGARLESANMTGIIILGILLVGIIIIGLLWGRNVTHR